MRLILVDPKRVEFTPYDGIPHLLTPVITSAKETVSALKWAVSEMERRYDVFQEAKKRNLDSYNAAVDKDERMPMIVIVIDELADLMSTAARDVEAAIVRLTQMARATGIHMIVATQRPSVDVITGLIKANITHRIAFAVASQVDSRTILDQAGAEKLLGNGDMLYLDKRSPKPTRIQGVYLEEDEINKLTEFLKEQADAKYNEEITEFKGEIGTGDVGGFIDEEEDRDELLEDAAKIVVENQKGSASLLQRRLSVGYARAARILDELQALNIVGPTKDSKPRDVLTEDTSQLESYLNAEPQSTENQEEEME
jgi:S-DNA-T family DNA segregation ATPase FtsK/SpoIIIE